MPRDLRALRQRQVLAGAGSGADPVHALSARIPAASQTLASVATQGRCGGEEQQVAAVGAVVEKGCLKRPGSGSRVGDSGAAEKVSFASEPQVRVMSPPAVVRALGMRRGRGALPGALEVGGGERLRPRRARFGGGYSVLAGTAAPLRRSMRNAANLGAGVEQVTVAVCDSAKFAEEGDAADRKRKRKSGEYSEHMGVSAQIGVSPRSTRSSGLLSEAPFVSPPAVEKKRARRKGPDVKEQTLEEQPAKLENRRQPITKPATRSNSYQELASSAEEEYQEPVVALCEVPPLRRSRRNNSEASGLLLNSNTSSEGNNCTRAQEKGNEVKIACLSMHNATKDGTEEGMTKEDGHLELSSNAIAKDCAGTEEQMVDAVVRKGCLKRSGADVCSRSSGVPKKVTFKLMEQAAAEVEGFRRRPCGVADREGDAGEADSDAPLRWSRRNAVNSGAADGVEKIAKAASQNISANAYEEEKDAGEVVDKKRKASENDIGYVWLLPNIATTNLSQIVSATKSAANKMATKVVANFGKKLSLYHADHGANKVGQAAVVAMDQIDA